MNYKLACDCGWETEGPEEEIVAATQEHGRQVHNMDVTHDEAMAMATPAHS